MKALEEFKESYVIEADDVIDEDLMAQINNAPVVKTGKFSYRASCQIKGK